MVQASQVVNLSEFDNIFCDSLQALKWAYKNGLPKESIVRTSSPAMLWDKNPNIFNVEDRWNIEELKKFQETIQKFSEDIFDAAIAVTGVERERALAASQAAVLFQRVLYKAACLDELDFTNKRLFIYIKGKSGPSGNRINSPWDLLLDNNSLFRKVEYTLKNDTWKTLSTQGVSIWKRYKVAGIETMIYRLLSRFFNYFPDKWFERQVWIPSENELVIETAAALALRGVKVAALKPAKVAKFKSTFDNSHLIKAVLPVFQSRAEQWVLPVALKPVLSLFSSSLNEHLFNFEKSVFEWDRALSSKSGKKQAILMNSPGTIKGQSLSVACRRKGIPIIAAQHGVAVEISKLHGELSVGFDNSVPDAVLTYNAKVVENEERSHFKRAEQYIVGASSRHNRMRDINSKGDSIPPIVYISTNLYRGNIGFFISSKTDFLMARDEQDVIKEILSQLPYQVRYKTYPDDNRRYVDCDPVLNYIKSTSNIELFSDKVDMRYLLAGHRVLVTSSATSTLSWPVMTGKPVVFINWKNKSPLTNEAHKYLSKGLFLFDDDDENFHNNVREFLSQSIEDIERLWQEKESDRTGMIKKFFSAYSGNSGKRAAQIILSKYM